MIYIQLLLSFIQIGLFSFGGGYASLPFIQNQVVTKHHWLTMKEFADIITISQTTPGPIAINAATFVGINVAGIKGAIVATIGCVLPSIIIILFLSILYYKYRGLSFMDGILYGLRPTVIALIAISGFSLLQASVLPNSSNTHILQNLDYVSIVLIVGALYILRKYKTNPIYIMLGAGIIRLGLYFI
ncbi:chromate transporter [Anaeromicropila herbilytica]|uniref:Chromate transporter n=1 Tax=Anaeromicropila herbilytica TaxID=2785025 RepID=A0A7R7ELP7_9FIRM|nr:chromate transporter [Anaeromicropila herbilytica]BCN31285.1 chromate transporter [Anaeromicropila herbilytica]